MSNDDPFMGALDRDPTSNPDNVGGLPDGMVMVQRSDAMRLAMFVEPLLTGGAVQLSARRIAELCRAAPAELRGSNTRFTVEIKPDSAPAGSGEVLTDHGVKALDRCCGELRKFIELAEDYDLDEMSVQALQTAIESMEMRKAAALLRKLQQGDKT